MISDMNIENPLFVVMSNTEFDFLLHSCLRFFLDWEIGMSYLFSFKYLFIKQGNSSDGGLAENVLFCLGQKPQSKNHFEDLC